MTEPMELEAKFGADDTTLARLVALEQFADFTLIERETATQDDTYYDTSERHLRQAGSTLRIRRKESGARMTFKGPRLGDPASHVVSRLEDEVDLDATEIVRLDNHEPLDLPGVPDPLKRARELSKDHPLTPAARIVTDRMTLLFGDDSGIRLEASIDRCRATRLADGRVVQFSDVELELKQGNQEDLLTASQSLQRAVPGLTPSLETKLQRALE